MSSPRSPSAHPDTLIVGAGLTGLSAAYHLDREYLIVDASDEPGGTAGTLKHKGFQLDRGIHILYFRDPQMRPWNTEELGVPLVQSQRRSAAWFCGRIVPFPLQFHLAHLSWARRCRYGIPALAAAARASDQRSVVRMADWATGHFGGPLSDSFFRPYNEKMLRRQDPVGLS